jgi:hypothetical protein
MTNSTIVLATLAFDYESISLSLSGYILYALLIAAALTVIFYTRKALNSTWYVKEKKIELSIAGQKHSYVIQRSTLSVEIAYRIYIELITRKAAIPFDEDHDIIAELYNSWYTLFGAIREEIKRLDGDSLLIDKRTKSLIKVSADILNLGLRPHLTKFQGRFRNWLVEHKSNLQSPQEIQRQYPGYVELVSDLKRVNNTLIEYAASLHEIVYPSDSRTHE